MWLSPWSIFQTDTFPIKTCQVKGDWWSPWELEFYLLALVFSLLPSLGFLNVDIDTVCDEITIFRGEGAYQRILLVESTCYLAFGIFLDTITRRPLNNLKTTFKDWEACLLSAKTFTGLSLNIVYPSNPSINVNWGTLSSPSILCSSSLRSHQVHIEFVQLAFYRGAKSGPRHNFRPLYYLSRTLWRLENLTKHSLFSEFHDHAMLDMLSFT